MRTIPLLLLTLWSIAAYASAADIKLTEAGTHDCVPTRWYDKVFTARQINTARTPTTAIAFANDDCSSDQLLLGLNGETLTLARTQGDDNCTTGCWYQAGSTKVFLRRRGLILDIQPNDDNCGGTWWKADIDLYLPAKTIKIKATEESSC